MWLLQKNETFATTHKYSLNNSRATKYSRENPCVPVEIVIEIVIEK